MSKHDHNPLGKTAEEFIARCKQMDQDRGLIESYDIILFAQNTGSLYKEHLRLANTNVKEWYEHIKYKVIPLYRKECHMPYARMTSDSIITAANELNSYYSEQLKQM